MTDPGAAAQSPADPSTAPPDPASDRDRPSSEPRRAATADPDPFLLDAEDLEELASEPVVRRGVAYFKENRVVDLGWDRERVWSAVEGTGPAPYQVELSLDEDGELSVTCDCPFDWEPACKHAVATILAYGARQPVTRGQEEGAAQAAVEARAQRGRSEVEVTHVAGDPWQGTWEARSVESAAQGRAPYRVQLRWVGGRINHCTCPDFAVNRLGTCKHIEAVLHRLRKRGHRKFERLEKRGPPASVVHLDWADSALPRIRLTRAGEGAPAWLERHFNDERLLRGQLPEAFHRLEAEARHRDDVLLAPEVAEHVRRVQEDEERHRRAAALGERIRASGGRIEGVAARLYPYQVEGVAFLATRGRALLADDMGLGKTLQAIAAAAVLRRHEGVRRTLVVCPASLKHQWAREVERFTGTEAVVVEGPPRARLPLYRRRAPVTVVNYELVLRDRERLQGELAPDLLILDEAQRIKNWRTKTAGAVKQIETPYAFVLTGTPLENRLEDLYSLMQVVDPRVLGPLWRYLLDFHVTDERGKVLGYRNLARLRRRLEPVMLRRDRSLVRHQLPDRIDNRLDVDLDSRQRDHHDAAMATAAQIHQRSKRRPLTPPEEDQLLRALQTARMACNAAGLVDGETEGSPKLTELATLLEEMCVEGGDKVVVFSQWERMTAMAEAEARKLGLGCVRLHGGVPSNRRGQLIERFRGDPSVQVFLSTDAGGVGLNLQAADALVNLDLPWNPAVLEQRIARIHRLGQENPVRVVLMTARNSYEERIAGLLGAKRELFRNVVHEDADEDVVGVSKKTVEAALATLGEEPEAGEGPEREDASHDDPVDAEEAGAASGEAADGVSAFPGEGPAGDEVTADDGAGAAGLSAPETDDESLAPVLSQLERTLGERIERVVASGGSLVVVVEEADNAAEEAVASMGDGVPVALVDSRSWAALSRLGADSPLPGGRVVLEGAGARGAAGGDVGSDDTAERKLRAAELLADGGEASEALELAATAMLHAAARSVGQSPPTLQEAPVWLHSELVPLGALTPEDAARVTRAVSLAAAPHVPTELAHQVLEEARELVRPGAEP